MTWQPLWNEGPLISAHAVITLLAMAVGAIQLAAPKGTWCHRRLGFVWVGAMASVAIFSFWIHEFRWWGPFSIIHVLSLIVLATLVYSIHAIRRSNIVAHRNPMVQLYVLALLLTGGFTLLPGRAMHAVLFGP